MVRFVVCALVLMGPLWLGCGSTCADIAADRAAFARHEGRPHGVDARLSVPFAVMDATLARQLVARPPVEVKLPLAQLGLELTLSARLDGVHLQPAPDGQVGVLAQVGLYDGDTRIIDATIATRVTPIFRETNPALIVSVRGSDLGAVTPSTTPASRARLARWLREKLPRVARAFATDELTGTAADALLQLFAERVWPAVKGPVLGTKTLASTELGLPDVPIAQLSVRSSATTLHLDLQTALPAAPEALPDARDEPRLTLVLAGPTAAALVNEGMARGLVPSRFTSAGKPAPDGAYEARLGWESGARPLRVHLWQSDAKRGKCQSAVVSGALAARVERDELVVDVHDGVIGSVRGDAMTEAFAWLDALWRDALELAFRVASVVSFEAEGQAVELRVHDVAVDRATVRFELD